MGEVSLVVELTWCSDTGSSTGDTGSAMRWADAGLVWLFRGSTISPGSENGIAMAPV